MAQMKYYSNSYRLMQKLDIKLCALQKHASLQSNPQYVLQCSAHQLQLNVAPLSVSMISQTVTVAFHSHAQTPSFQTEDRAPLMRL